MTYKYTTLIFINTCVLLLSSHTQAHDKRVNYTMVEQNTRFEQHDDRRPHRYARCHENVCFERKNRFKEGFILPQHYRNKAYQVDYRQDSQLYRPNSNQQWYKINDHYILLDTQQNRIIQIQQSF